MTRRRGLFLLLCGVILVSLVFTGCGDQFGITIPDFTTPVVSTSPGTTTPETTSPVEIPLPPEPFRVVSPMFGTASPSKPPEFQWDHSAGAESYQLEVATSTSFGGTTVINQNIEATPSSYTMFFAPDVPPLSSGVYYWRVTAINSGGRIMADNTPAWFVVRFASFGWDDLNWWSSKFTLTPDSTRAVFSCDAGVLTVISLDSPEVLSTISTVPSGQTEWQRPGDVVVTPDNRAVVANSNKVEVIDLASGQVIKVVDLYVATTLYDINITPDGSKVVINDIYWASAVLSVINMADYNLSRVNLFKGTIDYIVNGEAILLDTGNSGILPANDHGLVAVVSYNSDKTSLLYAYFSQSEVSDYQNFVHGDPFSFCPEVISPDGRIGLEIFYEDPGNMNSRTMVRQVDMTTMTVIADFELDEKYCLKEDIAISPDSTMAVMVTDDNQFCLMSLTEHKVLGWFGVGGYGPFDVEITADGSKVVIGNGQSMTVMPMSLLLDDTFKR